MANYISLKEATRYCPYSQDYLKLRARQGKLKALKMGRNWFTTKEWLGEYLRKTEEYKKGAKRIENFENVEVRSQERKPGPKPMATLNVARKEWLVWLLVLVLITVGVFLLLNFSVPLLEKIIPARVIEIER